MKELIPILLGLGAFTMVGWVVHVIVDGYRRRQRLNVFTDFHGKLMDRMGSAKELGDFLQSEGGQQFLETLTVEKDHPANRILRAVQTGLVLLCLGAGLFGANSFAQWETDGGFMVVGMLFMTAGFGFLLSATASYVLSRRLGLFNASRPAVERL